MRTDDILELTVYELNSLLCDEDEIENTRTFSGGDATANRIMAEQHAKQQKQRDEELIIEILGL